MSPQIATLYGSQARTIHFSRSFPSTAVPDLPQIAAQTRREEVDPARSSPEGRDAQAARPVHRDSVRISEEARELQKLAARDREVRAHEAAHAAVGGRLAGSPSYTYEAGPNGQRYAVAGEVNIDTRSGSQDPEKIIEKAQQVRRAALAPAQPSARDMAVAAEASAMEAAARSELRRAEKVEPEAGSEAPDAESEVEKEPVAVRENGARDVQREEEMRVRRALPSFERHLAGETLVPGMQLRAEG